MSIAERLAQLGLDLPVPPAPVGNYLPYKRVNFSSAHSLRDTMEEREQVNQLLHLSGMVPLQEGEPFAAGKVGAGVSLDDAQTCAQICTLNALGWAKVALKGDLDRIIECVRVRGFVASAPDFYEQAKVINACSDQLVEIFGEDGKHVRSVVGCVALPMNVPVEIDFVFTIR